METPADRIRTLQQQHGLSQTEIAVVAQVKPSAVNQWMAGSTSPSLKALRALAKHFRIRLDWLETGRGSMAEERAGLEDHDRYEAAVLDRVRSGEATGWAGVELMSDGSGRWHVHGSACTDRWRTTGALVELVHGVQRVPKG